MSENAPTTDPGGREPAPTPAPRTARSGWFQLRRPIPAWQSAILAIVFVCVVFGAWWFVTRQEIAEERQIGPTTLPSVSETFSEFRELLKRDLARNTIQTIKRVALGFGLACVIGVPLGILSGCFSRFRAFLAPLIVFGRNIPIAALVPLTVVFFDIGEMQKIVFIFIASVAFVIADSTQAIRDVDQRFVDTARTLGGSTWQIMMKVLVPLAMPAIFNSLRVLFGLAFGYIMLAEVIGSEGGLGFLISTSQRMGRVADIYLIILIIPLVAFTIDRFLYWVQMELFPHRYGGYGLLNRVLGFFAGKWDDAKCAIVSRWKSAGETSEWQP